MYFPVDAYGVSGFKIYWKLSTFGVYCGSTGSSFSPQLKKQPPELTYFHNYIHYSEIVQDIYY